MKTLKEIKKVRIRYKKQKNMLVSYSPIITRNKIVEVRIYPSTLKYKFLDVLNDNKVILEGKEKTLHKVKRVIKSLLRTMGTRFYDEVRGKGRIYLE